MLSDDFTRCHGDERVHLCQACQRKTIFYPNNMYSWALWRPDRSGPVVTCDGYIECLPIVQTSGSGA